MSVVYAARELGVSPSSIRNYRNRGVLDGVVDRRNGYRYVSVELVSSFSQSFAPSNPMNPNRNSR